MKKVLVPIVAFVLLGFGISNPGITEAEREMAITEMTKTQNHLYQAVAGLSDTQLNFKSASDSWSIAECIEHIALSEQNLSGMLQGALKTPADPSKRDSVKMADAQLLGAITDRSIKVKTQEAFEPTGKFGSTKAAVDAFTKKREEHIDYLKDTSDDLRNHYGQLLFGTIDGLQILLFISAHTERHIKQIEEVMANPDFPSE
ncbi:MAG TPA: DinB family protein [Pricia sp.]|nr:DinB family protein [Pricia sp.]